jgi:regulator of RNase E activity RraA
MTRMTAGGPRLRPMHNGARMGGPALTVKCRPGDNLMIHKALDMAQPGDVIVVDAGGDLTELAVRRDHGELRGQPQAGRRGAQRRRARHRLHRRGQLPDLRRGVTHRGPYKDGPGEINVPIAIDGMVIHAGDLVLGDADGLLCVPFDDCERVLAASRDKVAQEKVTLANIAAGKHDTSWVDARLKAIGCDPTPR